MDNASRTHRIKTWPGPFAAVLDGSKRFEYRRNDRDYRTGDCLHLIEWEPIGKHETGRSCEARVTFTLYGLEFGVPEGFVVMSLADVREHKA